MLGRCNIRPRYQSHYIEDCWILRLRPWTIIKWFMHWIRIQNKSWPIVPRLEKTREGGRDRIWACVSNTHYRFVNVKPNLKSRMKFYSLQKIQAVRRKNWGLSFSFYQDFYCKKVLISSLLVQNYIYVLTFLHNV